MMNRILGQSLPGEIRNLKKTIEEYTITPVNFRGGWYEFSEPMSYVSATQISVDNTEVDLTKVFSPGDPIRLKQGGDFKYFYVYKVSVNSIRISGGDDYTLVNAAITDLAKGVNTNPIGFPVVFSFTPQFSAAPGTYVSNNPSLNEAGSFYMIGPNVILYAGASFASITGSDSVILLDNLPILESATTNGTNQTLIQTQSLGVNHVGFTKFLTPGQGKLEIYPELTGPWPVQANGVFFIITSFTYIADI